MASYRATFLRHRRLLLAPIALSVVLAVWTVAGSPKAYESSASLWIDNPPPLPSSLTETNPTIRPPAEQQQLLLDELLKTRDFKLRVGREAPLARHLAENPSAGWGPMALLSRLRGGPALEARIIEALSPKRFMSIIAGPQVLQLSYSGPTPAVAAGTLKALIAEFDRRQAQLGLQRGESTLAYYRAQAAAASKAVIDARQGVADYVGANPGISASDPHLRAVRRAEQSAGRELAKATAKLNQVASDMRQSSSGKAGLHVIDAPRVPDGPMSGKKLLVLALVGGLFAGSLISLLGLIVLTPAAPHEWDLAVEEIDRLVYWEPEPPTTLNGTAAAPPPPALWRANGAAQADGDIEAKAPSRRKEEAS
jgi:uncharacterized protein involved in exopolysaccharide biosynthesis